MRFALLQKALAGERFRLERAAISARENGDKLIMVSGKFKKVARIRKHGHAHFGVWPWNAIEVGEVKDEAK